MSQSGQYHVDIEPGPLQNGFKAEDGSISGRGGLRHRTQEKTPKEASERRTRGDCKKATPPSSFT